VLEMSRVFRSSIFFRGFKSFTLVLEMLSEVNLSKFPSGLIVRAPVLDRSSVSSLQRCASATSPANPDYQKRSSIGD